MEFLNASNNAETQLLYDIDENDTSLQVRDADIFPKPPFLVSINDEIIKVNSVDGNTFSGLERGREGTTPAKHKAGDFVENRFTAGMYHNIMDNTVDNTNKINNNTNTLKDNTNKIGILSGASGIKEKANKEDLDAHKAENVTTHNVSRGISAFMGNGKEVTIPHGLKTKPTSAYAFPTVNPEGYLGEVWIRMDETNLYIGNSGSFNGEMCWTAIG